MKFDDSNGARKCMLYGVVGEAVYFVLLSADRTNAQSTVRVAAVVSLFPLTMKFDDGNGARKCMLYEVVGEAVYFVLLSADRINAQSTVRDAAVVFISYYLPCGAPISCNNCPSFYFSSAID